MKLLKIQAGWSFGEPQAANAGVDSIEHAYFISDENLRLMRDKGIYLVPTVSERPTAFYIDRLQRAMKLGVKIASDRTRTR